MDGCLAESPQRFGHVCCIQDLGLHRRDPGLDYRYTTSFGMISGASEIADGGRGVVLGCRHEGEMAEYGCG